MIEPTVLVACGVGSSVVSKETKEKISNHNTMISAWMLLLHNNTGGMGKRENTTKPNNRGKCDRGSRNVVGLMFT